MKNISILYFAILLLIQAAYCQELDKIDLSEAFNKAFVSIVTTAINDGDSIKISIEKKLPIPFIIVIPEGTTLIQNKKITSDKNYELNLEENHIDSINIPQIGPNRIVKGGVEYNVFLIGYISAGMVKIEEILSLKFFKNNSKEYTLNYLLGNLTTNNKVLIENSIFLLGKITPKENKNVIETLNNLQIEYLNRDEKISNLCKETIDQIKKNK